MVYRQLFIFFFVFTTSLGLSQEKREVYIQPGLWGNLFPKDPTKLGRDEALAPSLLLYRRAKELGLQLHCVATYDDVQNPDVIVAFEHPTEKNLEALLKYPLEKRVLFLWEPPSIMPHNYKKELHELFNVVFTWDDDLVDGKRYQKLHYPRLRQMIMDLVPFAEKKLCCAITSNKMSFHPNQLFSERVKVYTYFERTCPQDFDLYGIGWNQQLFKTYRGRVVNKTDVMKKYKFCICYENMQGIKGYVTEKIFDAFHAGCVPIYLGAENVETYIPKNCFIDRRTFDSDEEVYKHISSMKEPEYQAYISNIRQFLEKSREGPFSYEGFAEKFSQFFLKFNRAT